TLFLYSSSLRGANLLDTPGKPCPRKHPGRAHSGIASPQARFQTTHTAKSLTNSYPKFDNVFGMARPTFAFVSFVTPSMSPFAMSELRARKWTTSGRPSSSDIE